MKRDIKGKSGVKKYKSNQKEDSMALSNVTVSKEKAKKDSETNPTETKEVEVNNSVIIIDRNEGNNDINTFQKTGDLNVLEKVYKNRIPTIRSWANKYFYPGLISSVEDLFEELAFVFVKAAQKYDSKRGSFNTCLFTFFINRIKNLKNSKHAKKRISEEYDGPISGMILSLDYAYNDKDGSEITLKDVIPSATSTMEKGYVLSGTYFDETINILSHDNPEFKKFLLKISEGGSLASLLKEYKTKQGKIKINKGLASKLNQKRSCKKIVSDIIKEEGSLSGAFKLISYQVDGVNDLKYEVEMKKTVETDCIMKTIRDLRRNRNSYMSKIKGVRQMG